MCAHVLSIVLKFGLLLLKFILIPLSEFKENLLKKNINPDSNDCVLHCEYFRIQPLSTHRKSQYFRCRIFSQNFDGEHQLQPTC